MWIFLSCSENPTPETCDNGRSEKESLEEKPDKVIIEKRLLEDKSDTEIKERLAKFKRILARTSQKSHFHFIGTQSELDEFLKEVSDDYLNDEISMIWIPDKTKSKNQNKQLEGVIETSHSPKYIEELQLLIQEYELEVDFRKKAEYKETKLQI